MAGESGLILIFPLLGIGLELIFELKDATSELKKIRKALESKV